MINKINKEKAALNDRNPHATQQQEPVARSPGGSQTKTGQGARLSTDRSITNYKCNIKRNDKNKEKR
jgi:hypothetical protein